MKALKNKYILCAILAIMMVLAGWSLRGRDGEVDSYFTGITFIFLGLMLLAFSMYKYLKDQYKK
jgi:uncharacterized membrane protein